MILGLPSSGLHTNGYSLARKVFGIDANPSCLNKSRPELGKTLGEELLQVHRSYYPELKPVLPLIKGMAHITGGGFVGNIPRILPEGVAARIKRQTWDILPIFRIVQKEGAIKEEEMYQVFNMGIGITIICSPEQVTSIMSILPQGKVIGEIVEGKDKERIIIID